MIGKFLQKTISLLTLEIKQNLVIQYKRQRSIFDTTSYNPDWIPRQKLYHRQRKPRQQIWSNPNIIVPYQIPPIRHRMNNHKAYLKNILEPQMKQKLINTKQYQLEQIRAGDVVDITHCHTSRLCTLVQEEEFTHCGHLDGCQIGWDEYKVPKIKNVKLVSRGSGNFRSNLKHNWQKMRKGESIRPLLRNGVMKKRTKSKKRVGPKMSIFMEYDQIKSDNVKRILKNF